MCFSKQRLQSKNLKNQFKSSLEKRRRYSNEHELTSFLNCLFRYMESVIGWQFSFVTDKVKKSKLNCCGDHKLSNVRPEFESAFESCTIRQQEFIYRKLVEFLVQEGRQKQFPDALSCQISTYGIMKWGDRTRMTVSPETFKLMIDKEDNENKEKITVDLRNYLFRKSKNTRENSFVLESINSALPSRLRMSIVDGEKDPKVIYDLINQVFLRSMEENIKKWKKDVIHLPVKKLKPVMSAIEDEAEDQIRKSKEQELKKNDLWKEIKENIAEEEPESLEAKKKRMNFDPIIISVLSKVENQEMDNRKSIETFHSIDGEIETI